MATEARAGSPCELRFESAVVPDAWADVLRDVRGLVAELTPDTTDCRLITVSPDEHGATLIYTTLDGRSGRRRIADPRELRPAVEALLVMGQEPGVAVSAPVPPPELANAPNAPNAPASPPDGEATSARGRRPSPASDEHSLVVGAGAGLKQSWPGDSIAAVAQFYAGAVVARWELGAFGRWEVEHDAATDATGRVRYSAVGGGAMLGRREPIGPFVLLVGARVALFSAEIERVLPREGQRDRKRHDDFLDPRLGLYAGCIFIESPKLRLRVQVDGDAGVVVHRAEYADLGPFPRWNLGVSLGAEAGFFP
jgi:hypothetical protein